MVSLIDNTYMDTARIFAKLSKAKRLKVGSVLVKDGRIISCGYNGCVAGGSNDCEYEMDGKLTTKSEVIHSEANAILWAAKTGTATKNCHLYTTISPCFECCKMIIQAGIIRVVFIDTYRNIEGLKFLQDNNIIVERI